MSRRSPLLSAARFMCGIACIAIGLVGILVPLLPGIPFLILGAALLATRPKRTQATGLTRLERLELRGWLMLRRVTAPLARSIDRGHGGRA